MHLPCTLHMSEGREKVESLNLKFDWFPINKTDKVKGMLKPLKKLNPKYTFYAQNTLSIGFQII
jgi:hypothetical protein